MPPSPGAPPRLRVLVVTHELSLTGSPRLALEVFRALGDTVELRTVSEFGGGLEGAFRELGPVRILNELPGRWRHQGPSVVARGFGRLRAPAVGILERRWRPDVVLVNSVAGITLVPRLGLRGLPTLLYVHELDAALDRLSDRHRELLATLPDCYLAVSEAVAYDLIRSRSIPRDQVSVVPPLIDLSRIDRMAIEPVMRDDRADRVAPFLVGGAGNPHWTKGIELWLLMARELVDRLGQDAVQFAWIGVRDNPAAVDFRAMVRKLELQSNVRLIAETVNPYPALRRFDVFAMTSWEESASLVVLESMALEVPVVCFAGSGGPREQMGDTGVVIESFSPRDMAESVAALLADPGRRSDIGAVERARVAEVNAPGRISRLLFGQLVALARR
jgi:glycosyltransferase involved in cell wall biosynthesis